MPKYVDKAVLETQEQIIEVPKIEYVDKIVEVPQVREFLSQSSVVGGPPSSSATVILILEYVDE